MKRHAEWVAEYWWRFAGLTSPGWGLFAKSKAEWKADVDRYCAPYWGRLTPEHCVRIHYRFSQMRKEIEGLSVEYGMVRGTGWKGVLWPYAAIGIIDGPRLVSGYMLIPGAMCCPYYVSHSLPVPGRKRGTTYRALRTIDDMLPVIKPVTGEAGKRSATVGLTRDDVARKDDVRKGDCYLFDLTLEHSPRVSVEGRYMGRAVQFGALGEVIDTVRCRLLFAGLPSA
jgi:hypothetical protein